MLIRIRPSKCCKKVRSAKEQVELAEQTQDEHHKSELERSRVKAIYGAKKVMSNITPIIVKTISTKVALPCFPKEQ